MRMGFEGPNEIVPTAPTGDSSNRVANTAFVMAAIAIPNLTATTASLSGDVSLTSVTTYFDGPSIAQGTTGTWFAAGSVTLQDTAGAATILCRLWDGSTVISSAVASIAAANGRAVVGLSGYLASPAGNIRISCEDATSASGKILFNNSGNSKDSTISAFRIA